MFRLIFALFGLCTWLFGSIGSIVSLDGEAKIIRENQEIRAKNGIELEEKDVVSTAKNSIAKIIFNDKTIITLGYNSTINIKDYIFDQNEPKAEFEIATGAFHAITGQIGKINPNRFKLKTKTALIGIRGTEFLGDDSVVICTKGAIFIESNGVKVEVKQGNYSQTTQNQPPTPAKATTEQVLGGFLSKTGISAVTSISVLSEQKSGGSDAKSSSSQNNQSQPQTSPQSQNSQQNILNSDSANSWGYWAAAANTEAIKQTQINTKNEIINAKNEQNKATNPTPTPPVTPPASQEPRLKPTFDTGSTYVQKLKKLAEQSPDGTIKLSGMFKDANNKISNGFIDLTIKFNGDTPQIIDGKYFFANPSTTSGFGDNLNGQIAQVVGSSPDTATFDVNSPIRLQGTFDGNAIDAGVTIDGVEYGGFIKSSSGVSFSLDTTNAFDGTSMLNYTPSGTLSFFETTDSLAGLIKRLNVSDTSTLIAFDNNMQITDFGGLNPNGAEIKNLSILIGFGATPQTLTQYQIKLADGTIFSDTIQGPLIINGNTFKITSAKTTIIGEFLGNKRTIDGLKGTIEITDNGYTLKGNISDNADVISYVRQIIDAQQNTILSFSGAVNNVTENGTAVTNNASSIRFDVNFGNERASVQNGVLNFKYDTTDITRNFNGGSVSASGIEVSNGTDKISGKFIGTSTQIDAIKGTAQIIENAKTIKGDFNAARQ